MRRRAVGRRPGRTWRLPSAATQSVVGEHGSRLRVVCQKSADPKRQRFPNTGGWHDRRYLIHDRDPLFTEAFREVLVRTVKLPARSPDLNAYAKRFVRSVKSECLAQIIPLGERHLRTAVKEYTGHYHLERNHQGLENELIEKPSGELNMTGAVECRERLGGVLKYYYRRAA